LFSEEARVTGYTIRGNAKKGLSRTKGKRLKRKMSAPESGRVERAGPKIIEIANKTRKYWIRIRSLWTMFPKQGERRGGAQERERATRGKGGAALGEPRLQQWGHWGNRVQKNFAYHEDKTAGKGVG